MHIATNSHGPWYSTLVALSVFGIFGTGKGIAVIALPLFAVSFCRIVVSEFGQTVCVQVSFQHFWGDVTTSCNAATAGARVLMRNVTMAAWWHQSAETRPEE